MKHAYHWTALAAALWLASPLPAQDEGQVGPSPRPPGPEGILMPDDDLVKQMEELFRAVERNLQRIDDLLNDASAGDAPLESVEDSGLDDLLKDTQASSRSVVEDIDRILELARQRGEKGSQGQGQGQGEPKPAEGSPLDQARDRGPREGESTPEKPSGGKPEEGQGQKPDSPAGSQEPGATREGAPNEPERGLPVPPGSDADEWGMLPAKVQEIFRNDGTADLPVQYRDWIDSYYRRLNSAGR